MLQLKNLVILLIILAEATSYLSVTSWTFPQLSDIIEADEKVMNATNMTKPDYTKMDKIKKCMYEAYIVFTFSMMYGDFKFLDQIILPSPSGDEKWTIPELVQAIDDPKTRPEHVPVFNYTYHEILKANETKGDISDTQKATVLGVDISFWSESELNEAISNPKTNPELVPFLERARDKTEEERAGMLPCDGVVSPIGLLPARTDYETKPELVKENDDSSIKRNNTSEV